MPAGAIALAVLLLSLGACSRDESRQGAEARIALRVEPAPTPAERQARVEGVAGTRLRQDAPTSPQRPVMELLPRGIPPVQIPPDNSMSAAKIALGRRLFYDKRLSGNGRFACATCHQQRLAFTDGRPRAIGSTGGRHARSTMSLANAAFNASFGWADSSLRTLEEQMMVPLFNEHPIEMGLKGRTEEVLARFSAGPDDVELFRAAFPEAPVVSHGNIVKAIAAFERTLISGDSPFDRYLYRDDRSAMSPSALRGMELFFSDRLRCAACHAGFNLSGPVRFEGSTGVVPIFHNTGLVDGGQDLPPSFDRGLFEKTRKREDLDRFRAPTLRNIAVTAPYMHDGSLPTLEAVLAHYASGGKPGPGKSPLLRPFRLSSSESADVIAFLESLTDRTFLTNPAFAAPPPLDRN